MAKTGAPTLRVAAAQIEPTFGDVDANVEAHLRWIERARDQGVELLVFPELSLTGYDVGSRGHHLAISLERPHEPAFRRLAEAAGDSYVVLGFVEEGYGAQLFNAAALLHDGELSFVHLAGALLGGARIVTGVGALFFFPTRRRPGERHQGAQG